MKNLFLSLLLFFYCTFLFAQQAPIMVCNPAGTICTPYYNLDTAYYYAAPGAYYYIPGGIFSFNSTIAKEVHWIGAGFYSDSTIATGKTIISTNIKLSPNAITSSFEGFYCNEFTPTTSGNYNNIIIIKVNLSGFYDANNAFTWSLNNSKVINCVIRYAFFGAIAGSTATDGTNNEILNNIVQGSLRFIKNSIIKNNNFICGSYLDNISNCQFKNNITCSGISSGFNNGGNNLSNNLDIYSGPTAHFISVSNPSVFYESFNYRLASTSSGKNAGDDGKDIGIYGGSFPWKDGAVPSNPHINFRQINNTTTSDGKLPVSIKVRAEY